MGRIAALALGALALFALAINAVVATEDWWVFGLIVVAEIAVFTVIVLEVRRLMDGPRERPLPGAAYDGAPVQPGVAFSGLPGDDRAVVLTTEPAAAADVLPALGFASHGGADDRVSVMVVAPEGFGHANYDDEHFYAAARRAEGETVEALRSAGVHAAGHVGDHDPGQAITDALVLFPAPRVLVLTHGPAAGAALRADLDPEALAERTGARIEFVEL